MAEGRVGSGMVEELAIKEKRGRKEEERKVSEEKEKSDYMLVSRVSSEHKRSPMAADFGHEIVDVKTSPTKQVSSNSEFV